jgi:CBS domain-containing protein
MRVEQLMTTDVLTVSPETPLRDVARILTQNRISGLPVCADDGTILGVVSEADIVRKEQGPPETRHHLFQRTVATRHSGREVASRTAGDVMTAPPVVVAATAPASQAAKLMVERSVNRLPVVTDGTLVGIVTRADLVRAFNRPDRELAREIADDVLLCTMWMDPEEVEVDVEDGEVTLRGSVETHSQAELIEMYVRRIPGVVDVRSRLRWRLDDRVRGFAGDRIPRRV